MHLITEYLSVISIGLLALAALALLLLGAWVTFRSKRKPASPESQAETAAVVPPVSGTLKLTTGCTDDQAVEFLAHLREEKLHHKEKRATFTLQKLAFTTGLFGVAAFELGQMRGVSADLFVWILYLIPIIGLSYDVFIYAEDFKVKRVGTFIRNYQSPTHPACISACEKKWENGLQGGLREQLAPYATLVLTLVTAWAAYLVLKDVAGEVRYLAYWLAVGGVFPLVMFRFGSAIFRLTQGVGRTPSSSAPTQPPPRASENRPSS
jgi:hypothetical protein